KEPAMRLILEELGKEPVLKAQLALGEGTGGVMLLPLLDMAVSIYQENATFQELSIKEYKEYETR
ncbi:MAG TPA: nicotinate-nucleotide--dimethylbenzimidazole phosphoribosyltransferase, partial [Lachnospiraceae bacterium]|nr:nicotinate-nucleotide--dimethylbenzimidazole phosphoribosyltransferase [Lachnospiraceae bacterium]